MDVCFGSNPTPHVAGHMTFWSNDGQDTGPDTGDLWCEVLVAVFVTSSFQQSNSICIFFLRNLDNCEFAVPPVVVEDLLLIQEAIWVAWIINN